MIGSFGLAPASAQSIHITPGAYPNGVNITDGNDYVIDSGTLTTLDGQTVIHGSGRVTSFLNNGTVSRDAAGAVDDRQALFSSGAIFQFSNNGVMEGLGPFGSGVIIDGQASEISDHNFQNAGTIRGTGLGGVLLNGPHGSFWSVDSQGYQIGNEGEIYGYLAGLLIGGRNTSGILNNGSILSTSTSSGAALEMTNGSLSNNPTGVIRGFVGIRAHGYYLPDGVGDFG